MTLPKTICMLPWISIETSPIGTARPCCMAHEEIIDVDTGNKYDLNTATLKQVYESDYMQGLRRQFRSGDQPSTCNRCWEEEAAGHDSKRINSRIRHKELYQQVDWSNDTPDQLWFIDLKLGNICNLKCRICGSWSSSTFATEEVRFVQPGEDPKHTYHYRMLRDGSWPRSNDQFWEEVAGISSQIRYLEFTGGEPFMIQEHFDFLQRLADQGLAHQIEIHYNTNGTIWPTDAIDIWQRFALVEVAFSIDDLGDRYEYQRSNASWTQRSEEHTSELQSH
mgnify:CR=1 FL=1